MDQSPLLSKEQYEEKIKLALSASDTYYLGEEPLLDDAQYDHLILELINFEKSNPTAVNPNSPVGKVGKAKTLGKTELHSSPMLSLDNVFSQIELNDWVLKLERYLGRKVKEFYIEPKLDGLAIAVRYEQGKLVKALTRGDGSEGEDVTPQALLGIKGLPIILASELTLEVRGEVLMTIPDFELTNEKKMKLGDKPLANPRNAASGALRAIHERDRPPLTFFGYQYLGYQESYDQSLVALSELGFNTAYATSVPPKVFHNVAELFAYIEFIGTSRSTLSFGTDGAVIKANLPLDRQESGFTSRSPRWATAYKYPSDMRLTKLLAIELQLGRTGAVTPVGKVEPVSVGGTVISSVTLHNSEEIKRKDIRVGDMVWIRRAGEVIPEIVGVEYAKRDTNATPYLFTTLCPNCGSTLDQKMQVWRCPNNICSLLPSLLYFVSRDCMDIEGLGEKHITNLYQAKLLQNVTDIYKLELSDLLTMDRMGEKLANKILSQIELSKTLPFSRLLAALGFTNIGRRASKKIAEHFLSFENLANATLEQLAQVEGIGDIRGETLLKEIKDYAPIIKELSDLGLNMVEPSVAKSVDGLYQGKSICITGSFDNYSREELGSILEREGAKITTSVTSKTDYLLLGANPGSKLAKAQSFGTTILDIESIKPLLG